MLTFIQAGGKPPIALQGAAGSRVDDPGEGVAGLADGSLLPGRSFALLETSMNSKFAHNKKPGATSRRTTRFPALVAGVTLTVMVSACGTDDARPSTAGPTVHVLAPPLAMPGLDRARTLRIYLPPSYATSDRRYPVIYMHDGQNLFDDATAYAGEWGVDEAMDALAQMHGFEAIVVGIDNGGDQRMNELNAWPHPEFGAAEGEQYLAFLVDVVKPHIDQQYRTEPGRNSTAIMGSSMGGLASHYAIHARPDVFRMAGVLSPSYWAAPQLDDEARATPLPSDARVYLYAGSKEGAETTGDARRMHEQLVATSAPENLSLRIVDLAEHNEAAWRAEFPRAVAWLYGLKPVE